MRRKDHYLDYKASSKRRRNYSLLRKEKKGFTQGRVVSLTFFLALAIGVSIYFMVAFLTKPESLKAEEPGYRMADTAISDVMKETAGPYKLFNAPSLDDLAALGEADEEIWMADFVDRRDPVKVKGIYLTSDGLTKKLDNLIGLLDRTELNAMVIDVKDDDGRLVFEMQGEYIDEYGTSRNYVQDIEGIIKKLKEKNIYVIARVVALKDPLLGKTKPELALHMKDGSLYKDYAGMIWLNPFKQEVLDYLIEVAEHCVAAGFDEVNLDYIRFPTDGRISEIDLGEEAGDATKIDGITRAVKYLCENIKPLGVYVSADVFGGIITSMPDQRNVGQSYVELSKYLDYICPMVYPSHYANGYYGIDYPDTQPYKMMYNAMRDSARVLSVIDDNTGNKAKVRPWLQDFTASWLRHYIVYGKEEVREQIEAVYDAGYEQWFLWNAAMNYTEAAMMTEEAADYAFENRPSPTPSPVPTKPPGATPTPKPNTGQYFDSPWKDKK